MKNFMMLSLFSFTLILFTGCAASGQTFQNLTIEKDDKATVYFYRPDKFIQGGKTFEVMSIDHSKGTGFTSVVQSWKLRNNSFVKVELEAGTYQLTTNWLYTPKKFDLKNNEITCIKLNTDISNMVNSRPELIRVDQSTCNSEMKDTKEMTTDDQNFPLY